MPTFIVKPDPDEDCYVEWSTVVDAPTGHGTRYHMLRRLCIAEDRLKRADNFGSSAFHRGWFGWDETEWLYNQQGIVKRSDLHELCDRLEHERDVVDLLEPLVDKADGAA